MGSGYLSSKFKCGDFGGKTNLANNFGDSGGMQDDYA
jgi:hypothetical protein